MSNDKPASDENYLSGEFVVALPHSAEVVSRVEKVFKLKCERHDSVSLGLTRVVAAGLDEAAGALRRAVRERIERHGSGRVLQVLGRPDPERGSALDNLMFCLRFDFAHGNGGWFPSMGKNRTLHNVTGVPHLDPGSADYPEPVTAHEMDADTGPSRGAGVRVGILDTRLFAHPKLAGGYLARPDDLLRTAKQYSHSSGHSTFIAGLVRRQAPAAELVVRWALSDEHALASVWDVAHKMVEFRDSGIQILNLSLGCWTADGQPPMVLERAVRILAQEMVIVAAAGNYANLEEDKVRRPGVTPESAFFPAALDDVIAVGADVRRGGHRAGFSPDRPWIQFSTVGEDLVSTYLDGDVVIPDKGPVPFEGYARWSGTSFAAGTVTGALAALTEPGQSAWPAVEKLRRLAGDGTGEVRIFTPGGDAGE